MKTQENGTQDALSQKALKKANSLESNGEELVKKVEGTPFNIVTTERDVLITIGSYVVKSGLDSVEQAFAYIKRKPWELILTSGAVYNEYINEVKRRKK